MLEGMGWTVALCVEENCAELQRRIVCDPKAPIGRNITFGIEQIPIDNSKEIGYFLLARLMGLQPAVIRPML